jgi:hypothetical protein
MEMAQHQFIPRVPGAVCEHGARMTREQVFMRDFRLRYLSTDVYRRQ